MTIHIHFKDIKCKKCSAVFIPFKKDFRCLNCGESTDEFFDFIPEMIDSMEHHKKRYGQFTPPGWYKGSLAEHVQSIIFMIFDSLEAEKPKNHQEFIQSHLHKAEWYDEEYLKKHIIDIALATSIEIEKRIEDKQTEKLKNVKTGDSITIDKSYGVIGPDGKDNGWRFIRKKDADDYLRRLRGEQKKN